MSTPPAVTTTVVICGLRFFWIAVVFPVSHTFQTIMNIYPISLGLNGSVKYLSQMSSDPLCRQDLLAAS